MGTAVYNVIDAQNAEHVLNDPNLINKAIVYNFLHPFLMPSTGIRLKSSVRRDSYPKMFRTVIPTPIFHLVLVKEIVLVREESFSLIP